MNSSKYSKKRRLTGGLFASFAFLLSLSLGGTMLCYDWAPLVDLKLGITAAGQISGEITASSVYRKSAFGDITALYKDAASRTADETASLTSMQDALVKAEKDFCARESMEGSVLLKNGTTAAGTKALPLASKSKVTLFGYAAGHPIYRSSSGSATPNVEGRTISLASALRNDGFTLNETLQSALEKSDSARRVLSVTNGKADIGELPVSFYQDYQSSFSENNDAAIVMLSRTGGEGIDLNTRDVEGISQLALHQNEKDLLKMIKASGKFARTIVLINSGYPMELDWASQSEYGVDGMLWIGDPGMYGFQGVANLLRGDASPSGRLVDTYAANSLSAPAMSNFGDFSYSNNASYHYIVEKEGIYVGYKYYETRYADGVLGAGNALDSAGSTSGAWNYANEVTYPFGYGLSYTSFEQTLGKITYDADKDVYHLPVTVKNTGNVAGKDVVQVYAATPYDKDVCEVPAIRLVAFGKTKGTTAKGAAEKVDLTDPSMGSLAPGASETLDLEINKYFLASYSEKAHAGKGGYVLPAGDYSLAIGENAHDALNNVLAKSGATGLVDENGASVTGSADKVVSLGSFAYDEASYQKSPYTGEEVHNQLSKQETSAFNLNVAYLSRSDWKATYPQKTSLELSDAMKKEMDGANYVASATPKKGTYSQGVSSNLSFIAMKDVPYTGTYTDSNGATQDADKTWSKFLNQLTSDELIGNTTNAHAGVSSINSPKAVNGDGPDGIQGTLANGNSATCYNSEIVAASTFNTDVLTLRGGYIAEDSLFAKFTVLWGYGANLHRTPFAGRNFEYYSEDGNLGYLLSAAQISASREKGLITCIKHFAGNNQETNRTGVAVFNNEQAWRENALRVFEGGIAKGGSLGVMTSFTLIGCTPAPSCEASNVEIMQKEWGFHGINITDSSYQMAYMDSVSCIMHGTTTFCLDNRETDLKKRLSRSTSDDILGGLRQANKQYYFALLRSNAANGISASTTVSTSASWWKGALLGINIAFGCMVGLSLAGYIAFSILEHKKGVAA